MRFQGIKCFPQVKWHVFGALPCVWLLSNSWRLGVIPSFAKSRFGLNLAVDRSSRYEVEVLLYRGTSLVRNIPPVGPYRSPMPMDIWWSQGGGCFL